MGRKKKAGFENFLSWKTGFPHTIPWAIETSFHWVLDVTFCDDASRIRMGESAENMAVLRTIATSLFCHPSFF